MSHATQTPRTSVYAIVTEAILKALEKGVVPWRKPWGGALLCGVAGISPKTIDNSAAYIESWRKTIKEDVKLVVSSAAAAQRAADRVLGEDV